jgi:hypothetical protein
MDLFDDVWMAKYREVWNASGEVSGALAIVNFDSTIGWGIAGEARPRGVMVVKNGKAVHAGAYKGEALNWDLRATPESWGQWQRAKVGMAGLGVAVTTGKLKFAAGDYAHMLKNPGMAGPFVNSFGLISQVK